MKLYRRIALGIAVSCAVGIASAAEREDPTGTWRWSAKSTAGKLDMILKLKREESGDLAGTIEGSRAPRKAISESSFDQGVVEFSVTRIRKDGKITTRYRGKLDGNTITGTADVTRVDGKVVTRDWVAKRDVK